MFLQVLVTFVADAGCYYGRLMQCCSDGGEVVDLTQSHTQLLPSLVYFAAPSRRRHIEGRYHFGARIALW